MALDRYSFCPGGTGKKIKFCECCRDIVPQLEQLQRSLGGDQRLASLEQVRKLRAEHGDRASLLAIECLLEDELDQTEQHAATLAVFAEKYPGNPVVLAETALTRADAAGPQAGVEPLQRAIAACEEHFPARVFEAIGILGRMLIGSGYIVAGRAHLVLELSLTEGKSEDAASLLSRLSGAADLPLMLRDDHRLKRCATTSAFAAACDGALALARRGAWLAAAEALEKIGGAAPDEPSLWHNLGILKANLADHAGAAAALRTYAALPLPENDAVEAEALAQLLAPKDEGDLVELVAATWSVPDATDAQTRLAGSKLAWRERFDPAQMAGADSPPPLSIYRLLDRSAPENATGLTLDTVPHVLGQIAVFGRQTDREPRIEIIATRGRELDQARAAASEILGQSLHAAEEEVAIKKVSAQQRALTVRWHLPDDCTPEQQRELSGQQRRRILLELWPTLANPGLEGRTPREAASASAGKIALAAAVLNLELSGARVPNEPVFAELRQQLNVPAPEPIDPSAAGFDVKGLPACRLMRLEASKLTDEALQLAFRRAAWLHLTPAIFLLAQELTRRPSPSGMPGAADQAEAYAMLAEVAESAADRVRYLDEARQITLKRGESCARWDLAELAVVMADGDQERAEQLLEHLQQRHAREPGVNEALMHLLVQAGLIDPVTGAPLGPDGSPEALVESGAQPASAAPQIWTPGSAAPAPAAGGKKPVIWTPGS
jgi:hypothetical protein